MVREKSSSGGWGGFWGGSTGASAEDPDAAAKAAYSKHAANDPYPGYSEGMPYVPSTDEESFWKPEPAKPSQGAASGRNCGVGLKLVWDSQLNTLVVEQLVPGGAAARSSVVEVDDIICEVDGINVTGQPLDIVESLIRGVSGSVLRLVVVRAEYGHGISSHAVREIAITLVREPGVVQDTIRPKRSGDPIDNSARIKSLIRGSPADRSGVLKPGDILFEVDGTNVYRESLDVVAMLILGEPGTDVRLLFLRGTRIFLEAHLQRQNSTRQSDMEDVLRYAQSLEPLTAKPNDHHDQQSASKLNDMRMPASFRQAP